MGVTVPCALNISINPAKKSNLRAADITLVMTALNNSRQLDEHGNPVVADKKVQSLINRWLNAGIFEIKHGPLSSSHIRTDSPLHVGFEVENDHIWTNTELYPGLLKRLGMSNQRHMLTRTLNAFREIQVNLAGHPRRYNLSALHRLVRQPKFDHWYTQQPGHSADSLKALKQFIKQLELHGILPRR